MIYTLTLNPSVDHYVFASSPVRGATNRAERSFWVPGGKGVNVSVALIRLGIGSTAVLLCGGGAGRMLTGGLDREGVKYEIIKTKAETRINTKIADGGVITEINAPGGPVTRAENGRLIKKLGGLCPDDTVVLSGSAAPGTDVFAVLTAIRASGARLIADTSGEALSACVKADPYLIKPNRAELSALTGRAVSDEEIPLVLRKIVSGGVGAVLLSDGERGAYLCDKNGCRHLPVKDVGLTAVNATGAGDSMIAGYIYGEQNGIDPLACAVSAGSATAYSEGIFDKSTFDLVLGLYNG